MFGIFQLIENYVLDLLVLIVEIFSPKLYIKELRMKKEYLRYREQKKKEIKEEQYLFSERGILFHNIDELRNFTNDDDFSQ